MISLQLKILAALALLVLPFPAHTALAEEGLSTGEDVAIAFFKTGGSNPDFDLWARKSDGYKTAAPAFANEYLEEEKQRLLRRWQNYNPKEQSIELKTDVAVHLKYKVNEDKSEEFLMNIALPSAEPFYFPYSFQDYKFAVMPQDLEQLVLQPLQKPQYEIMVAEFGGKTSGTASLYIQLMPAKAYIDQPYEIDAAEQWVIITNVASLSLKAAKSGAALWNYTAPWYLSPVKQKLDGLYENPAKEP